MKVRDREGPQQPLAALEGSPSLGVAHVPTCATGPVAAVPGMEGWGEAPGRRARGVNDELGDGVLLGFLMEPSHVASEGKPSARCEVHHRGQGEGVVSGAFGKSSTRRRLSRRSPGRIDAIWGLCSACQADERMSEGDGFVPWLRIRAAGRGAASDALQSKVATIACGICRPRLRTAPDLPQTTTQRDQRSGAVVPVSEQRGAPEEGSDARHAALAPPHKP